MELTDFLEQQYPDLAPFPDSDFFDQIEVRPPDFGEGAAPQEWTAPMRLLLSTDVLQPMRRVPASNPPRYEEDRSQENLIINLGDVTLSVNDDGNVALDGDMPSLDAPVQLPGTQAVIDADNLMIFVDLSNDEKCLALEWSTENLNQWLGQVSSLLADDGAPLAATVVLRILFDADGVTEMRLDWSVSGMERLFSLPGLMVKTPGSAQFSVLLTEAGGEQHLGLVLTFEDATALEARSTFAWTREDGSKERELQNDEGRKSSTADEFEEALFRARLIAEERVSLVIMRVNLNSLGLPTFFRQLQEPLEMLSLNAEDALLQPTPFDADDLQSLGGESWTGFFQLGLNSAASGLAGFQLPFLKQDDPGGKFVQAIDIQLPEGDLPEDFGKLDDLSGETLPTFLLSFDPVEVTMRVGVVVTIGPLSLGTELDLIFNLEDFALRVEHSGGLDFYSTKPALPENGSSEHMGLSWRFEGADVGDGRYHYFTLATDKYAYELQQADGATFTVAYTKASKEPIEFIISNFSLTPKGISLTAEVSDEPVRMNGLDTRFRFNGSKLVIVENKISDFTLAGSGPLPPDLVGDAMVDIALQFQQQDGDLTLVAGSAQLRGNKLLDCKGTRFQFSIDSIGLDFVNENGFHLFLKLTGQAQFVLAPGDNPQGALAWLPNIKIELIDAPLTGDVSVLKDHIKFLVELPKPKTFKFLGCFEMELRGIGFVPSADVFDGDAAMELTGQLRFAKGSGDTPDPRTDYHVLLIGLPEPGETLPRIHFKRIAININYGAAFKMNGWVNFIEEDNREGFEGEGSLEIKGMPSFAASFAFMRVRRDENSEWLRAWFIYLEVQKFSLMIPVIKIYLREIGLGFGYRYTIASIKAADRENDVRKLLAELQKLSRTQGDLSKVDRWSLDLEEPGEDVRWTIVLRALVSQTSAQPSPFRYVKAKERKIPSLFLLDAIIAFRSDLTFFMAARAWIHTNYNDWVDNPDNLRERPFFSGFVLLSPRQKRFLAHVASNKEGYIGNHPRLPKFTKQALQGIRFSATLLIEPGLFHFELGWPNMLGWDFSNDLLTIQNRGGFIFRISRKEFVIGISYEARGRLEIVAEVDLGLVGVRVSAEAEVGWGARLIALFKLLEEQYYVYGAIGLEMRIKLSIAFWIKIPLIFTSIKVNFRFSIGIAFTASLEAGLTSDDAIGLRGRGTLALSAMGHSVQFSASFAFNESAVISAQQETAHVLDLGLEATDVDPLPGSTPASMETELVAEAEGPGTDMLRGGGDMFAGAGYSPFSAMMFSPEAAMGGGAGGAALEEDFTVPNYSIFVMREPEGDEWSHFVLLPAGERKNGSDFERERGFLPVPPLNVQTKLHFFRDQLSGGSLPVPMIGMSALVGSRRLSLSEDIRSIYWGGEGWLVHQDLEDGYVVYLVIREENPANPYGSLRVQLEYLFAQRTVNTEPVIAPFYYGSYLLAWHFTPTVAQMIAQDIAERINGDAASIAASLDIDGPHILHEGGGHRLRYIARYEMPGRELYYEVETVNQVPSRGYDFFLLSPEKQRETVALRLGRVEYEDGAHILDGTQVFLQTADGADSIPEDEESYTLETGDLPAALKKTALEDQEVGVTVHRAAPETDADWVAEAEGKRFLLTRIAREGSPATLALRLEVESDFTIELPSEGSPFIDDLERYDPVTGEWVSLKALLAEGGGTHSWRANWNAAVYRADEYPSEPIDPSDETAMRQANETLANTQPQEVEVLLGRYLNHAFELRPFANDENRGAEAVDQVIPYRDPDLMPFDRDRLEDERVYNPSDDAFEAAVRGALEQFEGSPFFKRDPNNDYDKALGEAFAPNTTAYASGADDDSAVRQQYREQSVQLRGMVIHDLVADLRDYVAQTLATRSNGAQPSTASFDLDASIAFQLGLVFRYRRSDHVRNVTGVEGDWLDPLLPDEDVSLQLRQRVGPNSTAPDSAQPKKANTFNIWQTNFAMNPPQFQRVQQYTNSTTIAITWDLMWPAEQRAGWSPAQQEPEHHLLHYRVIRRALDGSERDIAYEVKSTEAIYQKPEDEDGNPASTLTRLRPRFQIVDHFNEQTGEDLADLPEEGRSYLYTITPIDFENRAGRPLTIIATRRPDAPPLVPVDGLLRVMYELDETMLSAAAATPPTMPRIVQPGRIEVRWTDPGERRSEAKVPVARYVLIFRKEETLPVGSYGLDSETQRSTGKSLPTSNARPLPTDIKIELDLAAIINEVTGDQVERDQDTGEQVAYLELKTLREAGVLPADGDWKPESWRVFFQAISVNNVPSALAPVQIALIATRPDVPIEEAVEERRPAELEWFAKPIQFPLLPPEDQRAIPGIAHFPMPADKEARLGLSFADMRFQKHPADLRCVRFRWNQGPSQQPDYPLDLNAGYKLLELDIDAQTTETFATSANMGAALREIQDVQMLPAEGLLLVPGDTLTTSQWEAWYPSTRLRLRTPEEMAATRSKTILRPWYSWRESVLEMPPQTLQPGRAPRLFEIDTAGTALREQELHPFLEATIDELERAFRVDLQALPPMQPQDLETFISSTSRETDPYGWKILQHMGLSMAISLRDPQNGELVTGDALLQNVRVALVAAALRLTVNQYITPELMALNGLNSPQEFLAFFNKTMLSEAVAQVNRDGGTPLHEILEEAFAKLPEPGETMTLSSGLTVLLPENIKGLAKRMVRLFDHLYAEVLFQPGRSISLQENQVAEADALAILQLSLRPVVRQVLRYYRMHIKGAANTSISVRIKITDEMAPVTFVNRAEPAAGEADLEPDEKPIQRSITFPMDGQTTLYFRSASAPSVTVVLPLAHTSDYTVPDDAEDCVVFNTDGGARLEITAGFNQLSEAVRKKAIERLASDDHAAAQVLLSLRFEELHEVKPFWDETSDTGDDVLRYDNASTYFTAPPDLVDVFTSPEAGDEDLNRYQRGAKFWNDLRRYLDSLNGGPDPKIALPTTAKEIESFLGDFFAWTQRFFDHSGSLVTEGEATRRTDVGPWLVTAYPRAGSPAYATPDEGGRLKYDHIYEDKWAHNYRYYIQPYGRYDRLWHSYRQSVALTDGQPYDDAELQQALPEPEMGGLDVVIERTQPVDPPLILSSRRLDALAEPGVSVAPGSWWEVIIAQHPEQALMERNQTLARQIAFRQVAFTLLRRYALEAWVQQFNEALEEQGAQPDPTDDNGVAPPFEPISVRVVQQAAQPMIPAELPQAPEHTDFEQDGAYTSEDVRSIGLPSRIGRFQQGALVLQWDGLPFYYEHRLLTFAQTASTVSAINSVVQRDFEYITPGLSNDGHQREVQTEGIDYAGQVSIDGFETQTELQNALAVRLQSIDVTLKRFWDSLPLSARERWSDEMPDPADSDLDTLKFSALPDSDVTYQIVQTFQGNLEVQVEVFHGMLQDGDDGALKSRYQLRQLARGAVGAAETLALIRPDTFPHGDYRFKLSLIRLTPITLKKTGNPPAALRRSVLTIAGDDRKFLVGAMTQAQYDAWMEWLDDVEDRAALQAIADAWTVQEPISEVPDDFSANPVEIVEADVVHMVWDASLSDDAPLSTEERTALENLEGDRALKLAISRLLKAIAEDGTRPIYRETLPLALEDINHDALPTGFSFVETDEGEDHPYELRFSGTFFDWEYDEKVAQLYEWAVLPELRDAADCVLDRIENFETTQTVERWRARDEMPELLRDKLLPTETSYRWEGEASADELQALLEYAETNLDTDFGVLILNLHTSLVRRNRLDQEILPETVTGIPRRLPRGLSVETTEEGRTLLRWEGDAPDERQRASLEKLLEGDSTPFAVALRELLDQIDAQPDNDAWEVELIPEIVAGIPDVLPDTLQDRLIVIELAQGNPRLRWQGAAPTDAEREALNELLEGDDTPFKTALRDLLESIDDEVRVRLPIGSSFFRLPDGYEDLDDRLNVNRPRTEAFWTAPTPTDAERALLAALLEEEDLQARFVAGLRHLIAVIDGVNELDFPPLPESPLKQLTIEGESLTWRGRVQAPQEIDALHDLADACGEDFAAALRTLIENILGVEHYCGVEIMARGDLPEILQGKLVLTRNVLRYMGIMAHSEGQALIDQFTTPFDQNAIQRLYDQSANPTIGGRQLFIRTRRGSAAPSQKIAFMAKLLSPSDE